jgi:hypothetical protein
MEDFYHTRELDVDTEWIRLLNRELNPKALTINTSLLVRTYQYIDENPNEYDQTRWGQHRLFRADKFCFAGHAAKLAGAQPNYHVLGRFGWLISVDTPQGERMKVDAYAQEALGLTRQQGNILFSEFASKRLIRDSIRQWTGVDPAPRSTSF